GTGIAVGWTDAMAQLIQACDVVVQNAGGLSSLEALACRKPVLTYRCLPGHGLTNAAALELTGWVPWVRHSDALPVALKRALTEISPDHVTGGLDVVEVITALARPVR